MPKGREPISKRLRRLRTDVRNRSPARWFVTYCERWTADPGQVTQQQTAPVPKRFGTSHRTRHGQWSNSPVRRSSDNRETYCQYADGVVFRIGSAPVEVDGWWPNDEYIPQAATYLLGSVAGLVLQNLGAVCLHASTVNIDGFAVAFVGPPGTGKSTTAAALLRRGHAIITDDVAVIDEADGQPYVRRGYARLNLLDDAANALFLDSPQLTRSTRANGDDGKWMLNLNANSQLSSTTSVPLLAVYTGSGQMVESHRIVRYKPLDASLLLPNTFASYATTRLPRRGISTASHDLPKGYPYHISTDLKI